MKTNLTPAPARALLTFFLRRSIAAAGLRQTAAGEAIGLSRKGFGAIINGRNLPSDEALAILAEKTGQTRLLPIMRFLLSVARLPNHEDGTPPVRTKDGLNLYVGLEAFAGAIEQYADKRIPALLQTEAYARQQLGEDVYVAVPKDLGKNLDELVEKWMDRQRILTRNGDGEQDTTELWVILDEDALRRPVGGAAVMRRQLDYLCERDEELPNVTLQVLSQPVHAAVGQAFQIIVMDDHTRVAVEETLTTTYYYTQFEADRDLAAYVRTFNKLRGSAVPAGSATRDRIQQIKKELYSS